MTPDWGAIRRLYPALADWTCLNTATYGQLSTRTIAAMNHHLARYGQTAASDFLDWYADVERIRAKAAGLVQAAPADIAFCSNAAEALGWLIHGLDWQPGDRILTLEHEFPNNLYAPWFVPGVEFDEVPYERLEDSLTPRTRLVLVSLLNYANGFRPPLEALAAKLRDRGILLFVDGTQGVGALHFDVRRIQPAMLAVHGYKWMLSPTGAGFAYVAPELRRTLPPLTIGWRSHHGWRNVDNLHHGKPELSGDADQYEGGGLPLTLLYGLEASLDLIAELTPAVIEARVLTLAARTRDILRNAGATIAYDDTPIVAGRFEGRDPSAIARHLRERQVLVSARHGYLRVSPHFYNNEEDLARFQEELRHALA